MFANVPLTSKKLHLGCGLNAPRDWVNIDGSLQAVFARWPILKRLLVTLGIYPKRQALIPWPANVLRRDLRKPLGFPSDHFEAIYSSHTFEHLYRDDAARLAFECYRILKPGGICRIVVPDLRAAVERYMTDKGPRAGDVFIEGLFFYPLSIKRDPLALFHRLMNFHSHKWMYDGATLGGLMRDAGFSDIMVYNTVEGRLPGLKDIEDPSRIEKGAGVAVEGIKV